MRWLLTGEEYDAAEAHRIGLVREVVEPGRQLDRAIELANAIATKSAPLGVKTTLASAHRARLEGEAAAFARLERDIGSPRVPATEPPLGPALEPPSDPHAASATETTRIAAAATEVRRRATAAIVRPSIESALGERERSPPRA